MGLIAMSERDLQRIEILSKVVDGRMTMVSAAHALDLSECQVRRHLPPAAILSWWRRTPRRIDLPYCKPHGGSSLTARVRGRSVGATSKRLSSGGSLFLFYRFLKTLPTRYRS